MRRVLLLGASGFIGAHVRRLLAHDDRIGEVVCAGRSQVDLDSDDVGALAAVVRAARPDAVVNCTGGLVGTGYDLVRANTMVTAKLIEAIAEFSPGVRFVRLGSASEYGPVPHGRAVSEDDPVRPVSEYGVSHLAGTRLVELATAAGRLDGVVLRVFNPIGPGLHEENMLGRAVALLRAAQRQRADHIKLGALDAYRDFVDVRDVAAAVVAAVAAPSLPHRVFNVASGNAVTARRVVEMLAGIAGFDGQLLEVGAGPARSAAVSWIQADVSRARRILGWSPAYHLADSLKAVWVG
jgi:NDP-hexose 4-ketoreductase